MADKSLQVLFWVVAIVAIGLLGIVYYDSIVSSFDASSEPVSYSRELWNTIPTFGTTLGYIFGPAPQGGSFEGIEAVSVLIIVIAVWLLLIVTFGDVISSFSTFSKGASWAIAILVGIIAANFGWGVKVLAYMVGALAILGTFALFAGLLGVFFAFFVVNMGVSQLGMWFMKRKAMIHAQQTRISTAKGATQVGAAIKGMKVIGKDLVEP